MVADGKTVVISIPSARNSSIDSRDVLEKDLTVLGVSNAYGYTDAVINMLTHNAVNIDFFEKETLTEYNLAELLGEKGAFMGSQRTCKMTVLKMVL